MLTRNQALTRYRLSVSFFFFLQGMVFATWANRIPDIKSAMQMSDAMLGNLLFAIPVGQVIAISFSGWLVSRLGSRRVLTVTSILYSLTLIPLGLATKPWMLAVSLFGWGILGNLATVSTNTQGVNVEAFYRRSIMGAFHGMWSLGGFLCGVISMGLIALGMSTMLHFLLVSVIMTILIAIVSRQLVRNDMKPQASEEKDEKEQLPLYRRIDAYLWILGIISFCAMLCEGTMYDWSGVYFMQVVKAPDKLVQLGYVVCMCTMAMGRFFIVDYFVTRFGSQRVIGYSALVTFTGLILAVLMPQVIPATIGFFLVGFGISATIPICYSTAGRSKTLKPGAAIAAVSSLGYLGLLIGPPIIGHLAEAISLHYTFAVVACMALTIVILARRVK